ncbi:hypothetical protein C475_19273 [Halosimplex carlsbadense 2-9-1]|uniref:Uncharacterized protein n=1 Tax=Halosimplex carlsbadense 2-9-1 TaxID=797114 RepID=M0CCY0_9EURY|nr:hypothetical protein [Halosimplex carlsbadense]ELZ21131.1 hypothetical protein C475_19273 [Halosimplex carlsbadense 2-9-1]
MTRAAAVDGFETFVDRTAEATRREFSVERALRGTGLGPGGALVDRLRRHTDALERQVVEPELEAYRQRSVEQFRVILTAVKDDRPVGAVETELLEHDSMVQALDPDLTPERRRAVVEDVLGRLQRLGDGVVPIVERPEDEFWPAVRNAFDEERARSLVETVVPFTGPLRRHRDAFAFEVRIDPADVLSGPLAGRLPAVSLDYTDEAVRAMRRAERRVVHEAKSDVAEQFD